MEKDGGLIFISHSHQDVEAVRKIRNWLEENGFEPLLFFLKCLQNDDEIDALIKREIEAREWFLYVDSENARKSKWVKSERDFIRQIGGKKVFTVNLEQKIEEQLIPMMKQLKVYISCSHMNRPLFERLKKKLVENDFLVFDDYDLKSGECWEERLSQSLQEAAREGFVLLLVTEDIKDSVWVNAEIKAALHQNARIIPIYVGKGRLKEPLSTLLLPYQGVYLDETPAEDQLDALIEHLMQSIQYLKPEQV